MATYVLTAANRTDHHNNTDPNLPSLEEHQPIRRSSGRRKSKGCDSSSGQKKKQPQRGMGVAKLEKLRIQERWKKMTEINTTTDQSTFNMINPSSATDLTAVMNSASHVNHHVQFSKLGGFGDPGLGFGQMGFNHNQINMGFHGQMGFGDGCLNVSTELSSNQHVVKCYSDHCNACHKKKKLNAENLGCSRVRTDMYKQMSNVNGDYGFLGLNVGDDQNIISHDNQGFGTRLPLVPQLGYTVPNGKMEVDFMAVHKRGSLSSSSLSSTCSERESVLMEYEFFPAAVRISDDDHNSHSQNDYEMKKVRMEGSSSSSSSFIDLSLKLSYSQS